MESVWALMAIYASVLKLQGRLYHSRALAYVMGFVSKQLTGGFIQALS